MKPLPIPLRGAALGLAALITLSSAAALNAAWQHVPVAASAHLGDSHNKAGCKLDPLNIC